MAKKKGIIDIYEEKINKLLTEVKDILGFPFRQAARGHKEKSVIWSLFLYIGAILSFPVSIAIAGLVVGFEFGKEVVLMPIRTILGAVDDIKEYL